MPSGCSEGVILCALRSLGIGRPDGTPDANNPLVCPTTQQSGSPARPGQLRDDMVEAGPVREDFTRQRGFEVQVLEAWA
eukprot:5146785-Pyramimonas_sp.AAC.1